MVNDEMVNDEMVNDKMVNNEASLTKSTMKALINGNRGFTSPCWRDLTDHIS